jgi:SAM-dependent methyltransferase
VIFGSKARHLAVMPTRAETCNTGKSYEAGRERVGMKAKRSSDEIKDAVRKHYGTAIKQQSSCCSPEPQKLDPESAKRFVKLAGYGDNDMAGVPESVTSFGCGNPVNFADIKPGQTVLDLGSGSGLDLILAAKKVGPGGKVIGLDMTPEMIEICRANLAAAGVDNGEVLRGEMEDMPVPDNSVDWIISNCVINLSPEKERVFAEAFRVLRPGGRVLISDVVTMGLPEEYRDDMSAWVGCLAGAPEEADYLQLMRDAGFEQVEIIEKLVYDPQSLTTLANDPCGCGAGERQIDPTIVERYAGKVASAKISARKPGQG